MDRVIPDPGFADDDGRPDPALARALAERAAGRGTGADVLMALTGARLLVPVVAVLGEVEYDDAGLAHDKSSDMAAVLLENAAGRKALLAFTGTESMLAWDPEARPVPVTARTAAQAAVQEAADALVIDVAGPAPYTLGGDSLVRIGLGWTVAMAGDEPAWIGVGSDWDEHA